MQLTHQQRTDRNRLAQQLADLAGEPVPASLAVALYDLRRRGHQLELADVDQAAAMLEAADRHALLVIPASDRRRLVRTRIHLEPLGRAVELPYRLARLASGSNANAVRHKALHGTGSASFITIGPLVLIHVRADFHRLVSRRTREGRQQANNRHPDPAPGRDQGAERGAAHTSG